MVLFLTITVFVKDRNHRLHHHRSLMAVAPASLADKIIVLDGDDDGEEESLSASCSVSTSIQPQAEVFQPKVQQPVASPITQWPCVSARREPHVLQAENERLFGEVSPAVFRTTRVPILDKSVQTLCFCPVNVPASLSSSLVCGSLLG